jgi:hypothetical protein
LSPRDRLVGTCAVALGAMPLAAAILGGIGAVDLSRAR